MIACEFNSYLSQGPRTLLELRRSNTDAWLLMLKKGLWWIYRLAFSEMDGCDSAEPDVIDKGTKSLSLNGPHKINED